jgi:hypothetical protein
MEQVSTSDKDEDDGPNIDLTANMKGGCRKGGPERGQNIKREESKSSCQEKKDLSHIKCFRCDKHSHLCLSLS